MNIFQAIESRRSVRNFTPDVQMSSQELRQLFDLARCTPSSFNSQHWRFVVVAQKESKQLLCEASYGQKQVADASAVVLICARLDAWSLDGNPRKEAFYSSKPQLERDEALRSVGMVAQTLMLSAKAMGYDSCPMIGYDPEKVAQHIDLPEKHIVGMMVAIGKAAAPVTTERNLDPYEQTVFFETF